MMLRPLQILPKLAQHSGSLQDCFRWPSEELSQFSTEPRKRARTEREVNFHGGEKNDAENWRMGLASVKRDFNGGLQKLLKDVCVLMEAQAKF